MTGKQVFLPIQGALPPSTGKNGELHRDFTFKCVFLPVLKNMPMIPHLTPKMGGHRNPGPQLNSNSGTLSQGILHSTGGTLTEAQICNISCDYDGGNELN